MPKVNLTDTEIMLLLTDIRVSIEELRDSLENRLDQNNDDFVIPFEQMENVLTEYVQLFDKLLPKAPKVFQQLVEIIERSREEDDA